MLSTGSRSCGLQELWLLGSRARAQYSWRAGLVALRHVESSGSGIDLLSPTSGGGFFRAEPPGKSLYYFSEFFRLFLPPFGFVEYIKFKEINKNVCKTLSFPSPLSFSFFSKNLSSFLFRWQVAPACEASLCIANPCVLFWLSHLCWVVIINDAISCPSYRAPWLVLLTHSSGPGFRKSAHSSSCLLLPPLSPGKRCDRQEQVRRTRRLRSSLFLPALLLPGPPAPSESAYPPQGLAAPGTSFPPGQLPRFRWPAPTPDLPSCTHRGSQTGHTVS